MTTKSHWKTVYEPKATDAVSWYAPHLNASLQYIYQVASEKDAAIIDAGGGESTLVDDLLAAGYGKLKVLGISATALKATRQRLVPTGAAVKWIAADVLCADLPAAAFDVWHDRAVFHFLTSGEQRHRYVRRYSADELHDTFGEPFQLLDSSAEQHTTPWGTRRQFVYGFCRRVVSRTQAG